MKKEFNSWLETFSETLAGWDYYSDFDKAYSNIDKKKEQIEKLKSLVNSNDIKGDFANLIAADPDILELIPGLLAKRGDTIQIMDDDGTERVFYFDTTRNTIDDYLLFMEKTHLFELLEHVSNLDDYLLGIEIGMDTNARKNRTGSKMEEIVAHHLKDAHLDFKAEMTKEQIEREYGLDLSAITNEQTADKRFDFVFEYRGEVFALECNFYSGGGSKLNETARSYKMLYLQSKDIEHFHFIWVTDGQGWHSAKNNLRETYEVMDLIFNLNDLKNRTLDSYLDEYLTK